MRSSLTSYRTRSLQGAILLFTRALGVKIIKSTHLVYLFLVTALSLVISATSISAEAERSSAPLLSLNSPVDGAVSLDGFIDVATTNERLELRDVFRLKTRFHRIPGHDLNLGFVQTYVWLRFRVYVPVGSKAPRDLLLSIKPNFTDELTVFVNNVRDKASGQELRSYEMGDHAPNSEAGFDTSTNVVPLQLLPGQTTTVYVRARNQDASLNVSLELISPHYYRHWSLTQNAMQGAWFGGMTILLVIQFFFYYFDRKRFYILLAADIFAVCCTYFGSLGFARIAFFDQGGLGNDYFTSSSSWLGLAAGSMSIASILALRERYQVLHKFFIFAACLGVVGVACVFLGVNRHFVLIAGPTIFLLTSSAVLVATLDFLKRPSAQQALNFSAFAILWGGLAATNGQRYGLFSLPSWVANSYAVTSIIYFTLLTGSLAVRLRNAEAFAREADRRAMHSAYNAEQRAKELVKERTKELEAAKLIAERALLTELEAQEQQVRFMEVISHQYRTPLGIIKTNLESVRQTLPERDERNRQRLDRASTGIFRLVELLEVNLARSRVQGLAYSPSFEQSVVGELISAAVASLRDLIQGASIIASVSPEAEQAKIFADGEILKLAIINLLENAVKFSAPIGASSVWLAVTISNNELKIEITDEGIGIQGEDMKSLSQKGTRSERVSHIDGTGTGLYLVQRAVDLHSGRISFNSVPQGGTQATVLLPLSVAKDIG